MPAVVSPRRGRDVIASMVGLSAVVASMVTGNRTGAGFLDGFSNVLGRCRNHFLNRLALRPCAKAMAETDAPGCRQRCMTSRLYSSLYVRRPVRLTRTPSTIVRDAPIFGVHQPLFWWTLSSRRRSINSRRPRPDAYGSTKVAPDSTARPCRGIADRTLGISAIALCAPRGHSAYYPIAKAEACTCQ